MTLYVDSSAFARRYLDEPGRADVLARMAADPRWVTARHALVEVRRALSRALDPADVSAAFREFDDDWSATVAVELDAATCGLASEIAVETGVRTMDALHLAALWRAGGSALTLLTGDLRQARAARDLGFSPTIV